MNCESGISVRGDQGLRRASYNVALHVRRAEIHGKRHASYREDYPTVRDGERNTR